jgi:hypothetical protein
MVRVAASAFLLLFAACSKPAPAPTGPTAAEVLGVKPGFAPQYTLAASERFDSAGTPRLNVRIIVPRGLPRDELERNVRHALLHFYQGGPVRFGAVSVLAYASAQTNGAYDAAKGDFAPRGQWSEADASAPLSVWQAKIDIKESYFGLR